MKRLLIFVLSLLLITAAAGTAGAENLSGRSLGMGGAYTATADNITGVLYNPAVISERAYFDLDFNTGVIVSDREYFEQLYQVLEELNEGEEDITYYLDQIPDGVKLQGQALAGLGVSSLGAAVNINNKLETQVSDKEVDSREAKLSNLVTGEGIINFGQKLDSPAPEIMSLAYGVNFKLISNNLTSFQLDEETMQMTSINGATGQGLGLDAGVKARITELITLGAQVRNLWVQDYEIRGDKEIFEFNQTTGEWEEVDGEETAVIKSPARRVTRVGAAVKVPVLDATIAADLDNFPLLTEGDQDMVLHLGLEKNILFNGISLRAGTFNPTGSKPRLYTAGIGINLANFHLDTAVAGDFQEKGSIGAVIGGGIKF
ncbi:MAG: hypothetical protein ACOCQN_04110 [Halanaerobiaceae bacterium]